MLHLGFFLPSSASNSGTYSVPSATNSQITERGLDLMFRTCGRDDQQSAVAAVFLAKRKEKRIAIVYDNTAAGKKRADDVRAHLAKAEIADVLYAGVDKDGDDATLVGRIKAAAADVVYWSGDGSDAGQLVKEMRAEGVRALFMGDNSLASDAFALAGGGAVEGTLMTFPPDPRQRPQAAAVVREFRARKVDRRFSRSMPMPPSKCWRRRRKRRVHSLRRRWPERSIPAGLSRPCSAR